MTIFFYIAGVPGQSTDRGHQGWFDAVGYTFPSTDGRFAVTLESNASTAHLASARKTPDGDRVFGIAVVEIYDEGGRMKYQRGFPLVKIADEKMFHFHEFKFKMSEYDLAHVDSGRQRNFGPEDDDDD
jgi:hypothetical protein